MGSEPVISKALNTPKTEGLKLKALIEGAHVTPLIPFLYINYLI